MKSELKKKYYIDPGSKGLPESYPVPPQSDELLFYIQRNQNHDTIVYTVNQTAGGLINKDLPIHAYWLKYTEGGGKRELNDLQNKLAYGYESKEISPNLFEFNFVSYPVLKFYISRTEEGKWRAIVNINGRRSRLNNIYVYAVEFGVFPDVKFIELYGEELETGLFTYEKITV